MAQEAGIEGGIEADIARIAPGTSLRGALDNILRARTGALIVIGDRDRILDLTDGGFPVNAAATPGHLYELSKLDGALVLDEGARRVVRANVQLTPDPSIPSDEAGIKHRAAQRMARQTGELVIAISRRRNLITLYRGRDSYVVHDPATILDRVNQALSTLDRYRSILDEALLSLTRLEFDGLVTLRDVVSTLGRAEMVLGMAGEIGVHIRELGIEGRLAAMQVQELVDGVEEEVLLLLSDYQVQPGGDPGEIRRDILRSRSVGELRPNPAATVRALGYELVPDLMERTVVPGGRRVLAQIPRLPAAVIDNLVRSLDGLPAILAADKEELDRIEGIGSARARMVLEGLAGIRDRVRPLRF